MQEKEKTSFLEKFIGPLTNSKAIKIIVIIGAIVFFNVLLNGFVWDDLSLIVRNPQIHNHNIFYLFGPNVFNQPPFYRPLAGTYFSITYSIFSIFSNSAFFFHLLEISIHIVDSVIIYIIFAKFFKKELALLLSSLFLIHPLVVESVAMITSSSNPITLLFGLIALYLSMKEKIGKKDFFLIILFLNIAIFTKESGAIFFVLVLLYRMLFFFKQTKVNITLFLLFTINAIIYLYARIFIGGIAFNVALPGVVPIAGLGLQGRLLNLPLVLIYYLKTLIYPLNLAIDQQWIVKQIDINNFYIPLAFDISLAIVLILFAIYFFKRDRIFFKTYLLFLSWLLFGLIIISQIFPLEMTVADRFFYFPMIGLLGIIGLLLNKISTSKYKIFMFIEVFIIFLIIIFSIRTIVRNANWKDEITLYTHDIKIYDSFNTENNLGTAYYNEKNYKQALQHFKKSFEIYPTEVNSGNIGFIYETLGNFEFAEKYFKISLSLNKYPPTEHNTSVERSVRELAHVFIIEKRDNELNSFLVHWITKFPKNYYLWVYKAVGEYNVGDKQDSLISIMRAKELSPNDSTINSIYEIIINNKQIPPAT